MSAELVPADVADPISPVVIAMPSLAYGLLPEVITSVKKRFRNVKISVVMGGRLEVEEAIETAQFDFGIATLPACIYSLPCRCFA